MGSGCWAWLHLLMICFFCASLIYFYKSSSMSSSLRLGDEASGPSFAAPPLFPFWGLQKGGPPLPSSPRTRHHPAAGVLAHHLLFVYLLSSLSLEKWCSLCA